MAETKKRKTFKSPHSKKEQETLKTLEAIARQQGIKVSSGQLKFAGLKLRSGNCILHGRQWLIIDRSQAFDDVLDIYLEVLSLSILEQSKFEPKMMELIKERFSREAA